MAEIARDRSSDPRLKQISFFRHPVLALKVDDMEIAARVVKAAKLDLVDQAELGWEERR